MKVTEEQLKEKLDSWAKTSAEEQIKSIMDEQVSGYVKDQLKEQLPDALKEINPAPTEEEKKAEEKANEFKSFGEYLTSIRNYRMNRDNLDSRLTFINGKGEVVKPSQKTTGHMEVGDDSQGGFLVPEVFSKKLYEIALENAVVRPKATVLPMSTDSLKIPYVDDTSHASSVFGGIIAYWTGEASQKTASKPNFGQMELTPHKLAGITYASNELLADSGIALEPLIRRQFGSAWGFFEDDAFINGTGAGQPLGIINCGATKSVKRNTSNRVFIEDLAEMYQSMLPASLTKAIWVINPEVIAELIEMGSGNAADASGKRLVYIDKVTESIPFRIFGRPVIVSEKMQGLGTTGDIGFFDLRYYLIGDRQPVTVDSSSHIRFDYDETAWRFVLRVAGQCWPQSTLTTRYGAHTQSPFVVLDAATS